MNPLEFIDMHLIISSVLLLLASLIASIGGRKSDVNFFMRGIFVLVIIFNIANPIYTASCAEENIKAFNSKSTLTCKTVYDRYRVSKKDGWEVDKSYFVKESLMIRADMCERE